MANTDLSKGLKNKIIEMLLLHNSSILEIWKKMKP
jgi:hypothetical protein